jgi:hypothetical protein
MLGRSAASSFSCTSLHELMLLNSLSTRRGSLQIESIIKVLPSVDADLNKLENTIYEKLRELRENGFNPIVICSQKNLRDTLLRSKNFTHSWNLTLERDIGINEFIGIFDHALVFNLRELEDQGILILDLNSFGKLVQYRFKKDSEYPLSITIIPVDKNAAEHLLLENQGHYFDEESGEKLEKEKAVRNLMQKVHLQVWLRNKLEIINATSGVRIKITSESD